MSEVSDQYRTIAGRGGWIDRRDRGRLRFEGADVLPFLQALVTNDLTGLDPGRSSYAAYLTPQGRMIADLGLHRREQDVLVVVAPGLAAALRERFDGLVFAEDVRVSDVSAAMTDIGLVGTAAARAAAVVLGLDADAVDRLAVREHLSSDDVTLACDDEMRDPNYHVFAPIARHAGIVAALERAGSRPLSRELADALRIEAGRPAFGIDMTTETIPLEAGLLERALSTSKGCYVGQEVIIRVLHRGGGRVARRLVRLVFESSLDRLPAPGTTLAHEGREVGRITSAARSPREAGVIGLGYVTRELAESGGRVDAIVDGRPTTATIAGLAG